ncbi:MAG: SDR family oxidoreductase [Dehalococcoidia bacterium]|nr:SDR family oxidoreductase [Dehalococcoidia bacterium]
MPNLLQGKVVIVTGAGRGLGRAHALAMAAQGAEVVVNDLGVPSTGTNASRSPADDVVAEIEKAGGTAAPSYDSVTTPDGAENIIKTALDTFGRLDILVNNAGVLRDRMIFNMSDEEWDLVIKTHLYGTFYCTRAAARVMRDQSYGRVINTSSVAGMGNMGQANYAAAKEGIIGFTRTVSKDLSRYKVTCNAIRPRAATRMTLTDELYQARRKSWGEEKAEAWRKAVESETPEDVSPLVVYLASEQAGNISGCIFDVHGGFIALYDDPPRFTRTLVKKGGRWLPEELAQLAPQTLTKDMPPLQIPVLKRVTPDALGWEWADGVLKESKPVLE